MKKIIASLIMLLLLAGCNLPGTTVKNPDVVATVVAYQLTNAPTNTAVPDMNEPVVSAETPQPIATQPIANEATEPTVGEESTPEPTQDQPTPTAVPTSPVAGDPATDLGEPTRVQNMDSSNPYWNYEDEWFSTNISNGTLNIFSKGTPYWNSWYTIQPALQDLYLEATITMPNCSGKDRFGLVVRNSTNTFYFMGVTCDGTWGFSYYTKENSIINILDYQTSDKLSPAGSFNRIGILARGSDFDFYINGHKVGSASDNNLPNAGTWGIVSMSAGTVNFKTSISNLAYWKLP
ncbi:MAG: hypothetical protein ACOYKD_00845 [Anaerolineaceae bacterium]|jgi:hypothetical protein